MPTKSLKLTLALLLALLPASVLAQATSGTITLRRVPLESSLSSNTVRLFAYSPAIAQDTNHLWIGTAGGNVNLNTTGAAGANGAAGTLWYTGAGTPGAGLGTNADLYLDTATGNVYSRPGGTWGLIASIKGSTGAQGAVGTAGATGATGTAGAAGTAGATGAQGPIGTTGATGTTGAAGTAGATGATGTTGAQGIQGITGTTGTTGAAGTNGTNGAAATIAAGTTTTLAAGASATVTNTGTTSAATFNFGIPAGATGATGATGAAGTNATGGTVTSVGLTVPGLLYSVTGSPVTGAGTFVESLVTQTANTILAGPASGAAATPTLRALVPLDIPASLAGTGLTSTAGVLSVTTAVPAGTDTQTLRYNGTALVPTSNHLINTAGQTAFGGAIDTTSRVSVNPQGAAENGLTVKMPSGATGYAVSVLNSVNTLQAFIWPNGSAQFGGAVFSVGLGAVSGTLQSNCYYLGTDLGLFPVASGNSTMQTYWPLQLCGDTQQAPQNYSPTSVGTSIAHVIIPLKQAGVPGLDIIAASGQNADILDLSDSTNAVKAKVDKNFVMTAKGYASSVRVVTAADTATLTDSVLLCNGTFTQTLPATGWPTGYRLTVKDTGTGTITLTAGGTVTFDGATTLTFATQYKSRVLIFDGVNFQIESGLL